MRSPISVLVLGAILVLVLAALAVAKPVASQPMPADLGPVLLVTGVMGLVSSARGPRT